MGGNDIPVSSGFAPGPLTHSRANAHGVQAHISSPGSVASSHVRALTLLPLVAVIFFEVSGGPFGTEDAVSAAGPLLTLIGFVVLPLLWSVPEALVTAELATAFPENSGFVAWVTAAFGPFWGFQEGLWSWLRGVADNSLYPVMLAANLELFFPELKGGWTRIAFLFGMSLLLTYLTYRGLTVVGNALITSTLAILLPFLLLTVLCIPHVNPRKYLELDLQKVDWSTFLNIMFWNLNHWDTVSTLAGEVADPGRTFPRAMVMAVVLVVAMYLLPTAAALGVMGAAGDWKLGYYGEVAQQVGGTWLSVWIAGVSASCSLIGQYQAEMASDSYQLQGMAERGFLPRALAKRSRHGTPTWGILLSSLGVLCLASSAFVTIVKLLNTIYVLSELLQFAAFVWLRYSMPRLRRPYRVPLPAWGLVLMLLPATLLLLLVLVLPVLQGDMLTVAWTLGAVLFSMGMYPLLQVAKERGWCEFNELHFYCESVSRLGSAADEHLLDAAWPAACDARQHERQPPHGRECRCAHAGGAVWPAQNGACDGMAPNGVDVPHLNGACRAALEGEEALAQPLLQRADSV